MDFRSGSTEKYNSMQIFSSYSIKKKNDFVCHILPSAQPISEFLNSVLFHLCFETPGFNFSATTSEPIENIHESLQSHLNRHLLLLWWTPTSMTSLLKVTEDNQKRTR